VDPLRAREYFKGLLGKGVGEWRLRKEKDVLRPERRWEEELDREIEMEEIQNYLRKAKNGKAIGTDGYPMEFWKELYKKENISKILVKLMNKMYETGDFPSDWKTSMLHIIYKGKGDKRDPANYRRISLLSTLSKVYKGVLVRRLNNWIEKKGAISECQMGFRKGWRMVDNIFILRTIIDKYLSWKRSKVYWLFVDLQKAFDTIVREALWWKFGKKGLSTKFIEGVKGIYKNVKMSIILEGNYVLDEFDSNTGLRQGCSLSPALFNIIIDDILDRLEEVNTHPPVIRKRQIAGLLFADDLAVGATTIIGLQRAINCIKDFCEEWSLKINVTKTKIVVFKKGGKLSRDEK
jgi:hypothetical protein